MFKRIEIPRSDGKPYMTRWEIFCFKNGLSLKLHKFINSDIDCPHDHPWSFLTLILKGQYVETTYFETVSYGERFKAPSLRYVPACTVHKIQVDKPCWTLVFTFPKFREWGFFNKLGEFIHHSKYDKNYCE